MIFFTSDTHFNHANIIGYCKRPWATVDDMNRGLIVHWNANVGPEDTIYHLGDFALGQQDQAGAIFDQLNGEKHLVFGNHDGAKVRALDWKTKCPVNHILNLDGTAFALLVHNPASVVYSGTGAVVLHGHLHGQSDLHPFKKLPGVHYIDVGVDCWDYRPVSLEHLVLNAAKLTS